MLENTPENRRQALSLFRAGRLDPARAAYESLLSGAPDDADLLGLLAAVTLQQGRLQEAEEMFDRSLLIAAEPRIQLRNLHNFSILLRATGREAEAQDLAVTQAPAWPEGAPAITGEHDAVLWLAGTLLAAGKTAEARQFLDRAWPERSGNAAALHLAGRLQLDEGDPAGAAETLTDAAALAPVDYRPLIALSQAQMQAGDPHAARATAYQIARNWPVYADPPGTQKLPTLLVFNRAPATVRSPDWSLRRFHFCSNYAAQVASMMRNEYRFVSLLANLPKRELPNRDLPDRVPAASLLLNNIVNSEEMNIPGRLELARERVERFGLPVINHPDQVFQTTRPKNAELLAGIPNLKVPQIAHYETEHMQLEAIVADIDHRFGYPVIIRSTTSHQSSDSVFSDDRGAAVLISGIAELRLHLEQFGLEEFYAVEFVDLRRKDGFYRQQRAAIIDGEIIVSRSSIFRDWAVTSWRSKPAGIEFYRANPHTVEECNRVVRDPGTHLGKDAMRVLEAIRDRIRLDLYGVDFEVDRDGKVIFFEAGASMILHPLNLQAEPPEIRLPMEPLTRINEAFRELVARRIAEDPQQPT